MKILALETDIKKIHADYCRQNEHEVLHTHFHGMAYIFAVMRELVLTAVLVGFGIFCWFMDWPMLNISLAIGAIWLVFGLSKMIKAYIDWRYDFILLTTEKVILVDQTSIFKQEIKPILIDNIGSVSTSTQFWGLFPFGIVSIHLKEGLGGETISKGFVPNAHEVTGKISNVVTAFQRGQEYKVQLVRQKLEDLQSSAQSAELSSVENV